jgi:hypothetical protein
MPPDDLLSVDQLASWFDCAPELLDDMRADGDGPPFVSIRGLIRYRRGAVSDWLASHEINGTTPTQTLPAPRRETELAVATLTATLDRKVDPIRSAIMREVTSRPEAKLAARDRLKARWEDPIGRQRILEGMARHGRGPQRYKPSILSLVGGMVEVNPKLSARQIQSQLLAAGRRAALTTLANYRALSIRRATAARWGLKVLPRRVTFSIDLKRMVIANYKMSLEDLMAGLTAMGHPNLKLSSVSQIRSDTRSMLYVMQEMGWRAP